jgi:DNA-binding response OmpR family regulator
MKDQGLLDGKRVLVVDDEPDILDTLAELLSMCRVEKASDFESAAHLLQTRPFDLAVLDIMGVDGYRLLEIARAQNVTAVMLTAHALSPDSILRSYEKGAAYFVPKEKMIDIVTFLEDILIARRQGESPWGKWFDRMAAFCEKKFGADWKKRDRSFWEKFPFY